LNSYEIFYDKTRQDKGDVLRDSIHMKYSNDRTRQGWPFNTSDCLIEVTTLAGLAVHVK
jgi:hypothetical protein